jgi:hypothetical protein
MKNFWEQYKKAIRSSRVLNSFGLFFIAFCFFMLGFVTMPIGIIFLAVGFLAFLSATQPLTMSKEDQEYLAGLTNFKDRYNFIKTKKRV